MILGGVFEQERAGGKAKKGVGGGGGDGRGGGRKLIGATAWMARKKNRWYQVPDSVPDFDFGWGVRAIGIGGGGGGRDSSIRSRKL